MATLEARCRSSRLHAVYVYEPVPTAEVATTPIMATSMWTSVASSTDMREEASRHRDEERLRARHEAEGRLRNLIRQADTDLHGIDVAQTVSATNTRQPHSCSFPTVRAC